jgi:hypothetical protein
MAQICTNRCRTPHGPPPPAPEPEETNAEPDQSDDEEEDNQEPGASVPASQAQEEEADVHQDERRALLHTTGGGDDAVATRTALAAFEERARVMRNAIPEGRGSFEWYFVKQPRRRTAEAAEYLARDEPIPPDVQEYEEGRQPWGPYLRYRWWEGAERYSIGMGHIRRRDPQRPDEPPVL